MYIDTYSTQHVYLASLSLDDVVPLLLNPSIAPCLKMFAAFCGLGIHNVLMYERIVKSMAKQKVALEVLSYHASASSEETEHIMVNGT